mmetsp:Transcript_7203/g.13807  ORF Transcript_7203/g.13807 Transcript_7203/m.13807 type:complete len:355 (-) Transcript_7203:759-1823(-)
MQLQNDSLMTTSKCKLRASHFLISHLTLPPPVSPRARAIYTTDARVPCVFVFSSKGRENVMPLPNSHLRSIGTIIILLLLKPGVVPLLELERVREVGVWDVADVMRPPLRILSHDVGQGLAVLGIEHEKHVLLVARAALRADLLQVAVVPSTVPLAPMLSRRPPRTREPLPQHACGGEERMHVPAARPRHLSVEQAGGFRPIFFRLPPPPLQLLGAVDLDAPPQPNVGVIMPVRPIDRAIEIVFVPVREHAHPPAGVGGGTLRRSFGKHITVAQRAHELARQKLVQVRHNEGIMIANVMSASGQPVSRAPLTNPSALHHSWRPVWPGQLLVHAAGDEVLCAIIIEIVRHVPDFV